MCHPVFLGMREDRPAASVRKETARLPNSETNEENGPPLDKGGLQENALSKRHSHKPPPDPLLVQGAGKQVGPKLTGNDGSISVNARTVKLTNLNKVYWPEEKFAKRDQVTYYQEMAPFILPYLKDRPQSLNRHPNGIHGESFYQQDLEHHPEWVKTVRVRSKSQNNDSFSALSGHRHSRVHGQSGLHRNQSVGFPLGNARAARLLRH